MIDVEVSAGEIYAVDVEKNEVRIEVDGWAPTATAPRLDRRVDAAISGVTGELVFPTSAVTVESPGNETWTTFDDGMGQLELSAESHVIQVETNIGIYVALAGTCSLSRDNESDRVSVQLDGPVPVTLGFRSHVNAPRNTITVPRNLDGAASAVRHLSAGIGTDSPDKSYPTLRAHPPAIEFGDTVHIPSQVYRDAEFSSITLRLPMDLGALFVSSPLAYYLQADVVLEERRGVALDAPDLSEPRCLGTGMQLERNVASLLRRVFFLDCLVRNAGRYEVELKELELLDGLDIDIDELYYESTAGRLKAYLDTDFDSVSSGFPQWNLSTVLEPTIGKLRVIPHLLERLSLIQLPRPTKVDRLDLVVDAVGNAYRAPDCSTGNYQSDRYVRNELQFGQVRGWMHDGVPIDAFRPTIESFENRPEYHQRSDGPRSVNLVLNDSSMLDERERVESIYRQRADELRIDFEVHESLTSAELQDVLESPIDFLHFVGHCEESGLRCTDGMVSTTDLKRTRVQTFFLNSCKSFKQGLGLVRKGGIAGAVTLKSVLNGDATMVGTSFARLIMHGFNLVEALDIARRRTFSSSYYTVVGDGTHRFSQGDDITPSILHVMERSPDIFDATFEFSSVNMPGGTAMPLIDDIHEYHLCGNKYNVELERETFISFLRASSIPVIHEGQYTWSTDLASKLDPGRT